MDRRGVLVSALIAVFGIAGCSADGRSDRNVAAAQPSPTPAVIDGEECATAPPELQLPADAGCASWASGEFERGSTNQTLIVYARTDTARMPTEWHMRVTRDGTTPLDDVVDIGSAASYPVVVGAEDADGAGLDEAFVKVVSHTYHSGKTYELGVFGVNRGRVFQVESDGEPFVFQVGGVSVFGEGAECRDVDGDRKPEFLLFRVDGVTNYMQTWTQRTFEWKDRSLELIDRTEERFVKSGYTDPLLLRAYSFRCLTLDPPYPYAR